MTNSFNNINHTISLKVLYNNHNTDFNVGWWFSNIQQQCYIFRNAGLPGMNSFTTCGITECGHLNFIKLLKNDNYFQYYVNG